MQSQSGWWASPRPLPRLLVRSDYLHVPPVMMADELGRLDLTKYVCKVVLLCDARRKVLSLRTVSSRHARPAAFLGTMCPSWSLGIFADYDERFTLNSGYEYKRSE